jgi:hypothetical protein
MGSNLSPAYDQLARPWFHKQLAQQYRDGKRRDEQVPERSVSHRAEYGNRLFVDEPDSVRRSSSSSTTNAARSTILPLRTSPSSREPVEWSNWTGLRT